MKLLGCLFSTNGVRWSFSFSWFWQASDRLHVMSDVSVEYRWTRPTHQPLTPPEPPTDWPTTDWPTHTNPTRLTDSPPPEPPYWLIADQHTEPNSWTKRVQHKLFIFIFNKYQYQLSIRFRFRVNFGWGLSCRFVGLNSHSISQSTLWCPTGSFWNSAIRTHLTISPMIDFRRHYRRHFGFPWLPET